MATVDVIGQTPVASPLTNQRQNPWFHVLTVVVIVIGIVYAGYHLADDLSVVRDTRAYPFVLLGIALAIALGFEFVNGFHDTANAVATVIYTHSMPPNLAVIWSGFFNFLGVLVSSGAVAFGIVSLLPVELILQVSSGAGFAMVFALLIAAILWNLGTWYLGLPSSSSHTLIGSIMGVGLMNQLMAGPNGASGVDWGQAAKIGQSLLFSPLIGFSAAALLLMIMKALIPSPNLFKEPQGNKPPPFLIRGLLVLTCTGVSFAHGSNDGQKGMGLIMLILIGTVPTAYALNRTMHEQDVARFVSTSTQAHTILARTDAPQPTPDDARAKVIDVVRQRTVNADGLPALAALSSSIANQVDLYHSLAKVPADKMVNIRNDMYLESEGLRLLAKSKTVTITTDEQKTLSDYKKQLDNATKFIPSWVKVAVAIALGLGTMIGWKRIVVTVGERIGKTHLTYAQGASAELVAMVTIGAADMYGLPVSTTHVLSSGVAGTMVANRSGLQWATVRNLLMAWVLTLPVSIALAGGLYWILRTVL